MRFYWLLYPLNLKAARLVCLPAELQSPDLVYVAGAPDVSEQPIAAKALIDFLADPKAAAVYKAKGLQPG
jgi:ABC-type molybdate transport system substrate-binding protein